jgi:hypothetical protein
MARPTGDIALATEVNSGKSGIKVATPDLIVFDASTISVDSMADLIFEDIGGQELLEISRSDLINSANVSFPKIQTRIITSASIASLAGGEVFAPSQSISLAEHVPQFQQPVSVNDLGGIEVNVINMLPEYQVEVQIVSKANRFDDTIYTEEQGEQS